MASSSYHKAFKKLMRSLPDPSDLPSMLIEIYRGLDRATVILQVATIDDVLEALLLAKMRHDLSNDHKDRLFENNGPLASLGNKILLAYSISLYGKVFYHDLNLVRELRNGFAHATIPMTFSTPEISGMCTHLKVPDNPICMTPGEYFKYFPDPTVAADRNHPRTRFTTACHTIISKLWEAQVAIQGGFPCNLP